MAAIPPPPLHDVHALLRQHHEQALLRLEHWIACEEQLAVTLLRQAAAQGAASRTQHGPWEGTELVPPSRPVALLKGAAQAPAAQCTRSEGDEVAIGLGEESLGLGEAGACLVIEPSGATGAAETPAKAEEVPNERQAGASDEAPHDLGSRISIALLTSEDDEMDMYADGVLTADGSKKAADSEEQGPKGSLIVRTVASSHFEAISGMVVVLYTALIGLEVELRARLRQDGAPLWLYVTDYVCTAWFVVELLLRLGAEGLHVFRSLQRGWILFDAVLVLSSFVDLGFAIFRDSDTASSLSAGRISRILRVTRLIRVMRAVRIIRFVRALRVMLYSIVSAIKSLVWAVVLLFMVIYFFAVIFTHAILMQPLSEDTAQAESELCSPVVSEGLKYWGSLGTSMLTLSESVIGGVDWKDPLAPLADIHFVWMVTFVVFILFTYFAILNIITAAFCQGALEGQQYDREQTVRGLVSNKESSLYKTKDLFANMFSKMDIDGSGKITWDEFSSHVADDSVQALLALLDLNESDLWVLFQLLDGKKSTGIDATEFVSGCMRLKRPARSIDSGQVARNQKKLTDRVLHFMRFVSQEMVELRKIPTGASNTSNKSDVVLPQTSG